MKPLKKKLVEEDTELTDEEVDALTSDKERDGSSVSFCKMQKAVSLLQDEFGLTDKGYSVTEFADKGKSVKVSMTNGAFDISVVINDPEVYGITAD